MAHKIKVLDNKFYEVKSRNKTYKSLGKHRKQGQKHTLQIDKVDKKLNALVKMLVGFLVANI